MRGLKLRGYSDLIQSRWSHRLRTMRGLKFLCLTNIKEMEMSHRLRTMRGLKFDRLVLLAFDVHVASFAYDAWIEISINVFILLLSHSRIVCI